MKYNFLGEVRKLSDSRVIEGKAITFETESNDLGFIEVVHRGAITQEVINSSDIVFNYNHKRDNILARSNKGSGSLSVELKEDGVYFRMEAPHTQFADEVLEQIERGDLNKCSFCFTIPKVEGAEKWSKRSDGKMQRDIYMINELFDLSVVVDAAYSDTYISARNQEAMEAEKQLAEVTEETPEEEINKDTETIIEEVVEETPVVEEVEIKEEEERSLPESNNTNTEIKFSTMEKRFSFIKAINAVANNQHLDEVNAAVVNEGIKMMRNAGLSFGGQIQIPVGEVRAAFTDTTGNGSEIVATEVFDIVSPLRAKNVLVQAGAKFLTGLVGDVKIPVMGANSVDWATETGAASDGAGGFADVTLTPKRLTAYVEISKQLLTQDSVDVENAIRQDLINAINSKLEETILGSAAGTASKPAGMFNGKTTVKSATTMAKIAEVEAGVEAKGVYGDTKWIVSPSFKSALRAVGKTGNGSNPIYMNGEIDGTPALSTGNVGAGLAVYGDFSNLAIGHWGAVDVTVDPYTQAKNGKIVLVVNTYFDAKELRDVFGFATTSAS